MRPVDPGLGPELVQEAGHVGGEGEDGCHVDQCVTLTTLYYSPLSPVLHSSVWSILLAGLSTAGGWLLHTARAAGHQLFFNWSPISHSNQTDLTMGG